SRSALLRLARMPRPGAPVRPARSARSPNRSGAAPRRSAPASPAAIAPGARASSAARPRSAASVARFQPCSRSFGRTGSHPSSCRAPNKGSAHLAADPLPSKICLEIVADTRIFVLIFDQRAALLQADHTLPFALGSQPVHAQRQQLAIHGHVPRRSSPAVEVLVEPAIGRAVDAVA